MFHVIVKHKGNDAKGIIHPELPATSIFQNNLFNVKLE